jgi:hypothetical protein
MQGQAQQCECACSWGVLGDAQPFSLPNENLTLDDISCLRNPPMSDHFMLLILLIPTAKNIIALAQNQTNEPGMTPMQQ